MAGGDDQATAVLPENLGTAKTEMVNTPQREGIGPTLSRGDRLGRYVIVERLGAGGMGVVYRAHDPELDRHVAIKVLNIGIGSTAGDYRARLLREGQALAKVSHPNVIAIYDVGEKGRDVFIAMELVEGKSMRQWLRAQRHPFAEVVRVFVAAGRGLAAAHAVGLVHRDFKPENVIIGNDDRVRVLDFGIARVAQGTDEPELASGSPVSPSSSGNQLHTPLTHAGAIVGTPLYMRPSSTCRYRSPKQRISFRFACRCGKRSTASRRSRSPTRRI